MISFYGLEPANKNIDTQKAAAVINKLLYAAQPFRQNAVIQAAKNLAILRNKFSAVFEPERYKDTSGVLSFVEGQERPYYGVNLVLGNAMLREVNYASVIPDVTVERLTMSEKDRLTAEFCAALANRYLAPQLSALRDLFAMKIIFEGHTLIFISWDPTLGPRLRRPVKTTEPVSIYNTVKRQNKPLNEETDVQKKLAGIIPFGTERRQVYHKVDEWGQLMFDEIPIGLPRFDIVGPLDYIIDPLANDGGVMFARWVARQMRVDAAVLFEQFGNKNLFPDALQRLKEFKGWSKSLSVDDGERYLREKLGKPIQNDAANTAVLTVLYMRPSPNIGLPRGLYAIIISQESLASNAPGNTEVLYWGELPWPYELPCIDGAVEIMCPHDFYGDTYVRMVSPLNHLYNRLIGYLDEAASLASRRLLVGVSSENQNLRILPLEGTTGTEVVIPPDTMQPGQQISMLHYDGSALFQLRLAQEIVGMIQSISNSHGPITVGESKVATELLTAMEKDESVAGRVKERIANSYTNAIHFGVQLMQRYLDVNKLLMLMPDYTTGEAESFLTADLSKFSTKFRLKKSIYFSNNMTVRIELLKYIAQLGDRATQLGLNPSEWADMFVNREFSPQDISRLRHAEVAEAENAMFMRDYEKINDKRAESFVNNIDDDDIHLSVHEKILTMRDRNRLNSRLQLIVKIHCDKHKQNKQAKELQKIQLMLLAQNIVQSAQQLATKETQKIGGVNASKE